MILDEATSSLDSTSEEYIHNVIDHLSKQAKAIILIAHRLATVVNANKIVVLNKGKLVEKGSHRQLLKNKKAYWATWEKQFPRTEELL